MGASASTFDTSVPENGKIFKELSCGCICSCNINNYMGEDISLITICYECLYSLKTQTYDTIKIKRIEKETYEVNVQHLVDENHWFTLVKAIIIASNKKIPIEEFDINRNLLQKYGIL